MCYGVGENLYGAREIAAFRARRGGAPERRLRRIAVSTFGTQFGSACVEYVRPADPVIGRQTQSWVRMPEGWRIVAAHVSRMASDP